MSSSESGTSTGILRLHIGGTEVKEGWSIVNIQPGPDVDYVGNCTDLGEIKDNSVDEIYASHVVEHLGYQKDIQDAMREFYRVLKPEGRIRISVPDLEILCRMFLADGIDAQQRFHIMRIMFGGQIDDYDYHHVGLTLEFMAYFIKLAGFTEIKRVPEFGIFNDSSSIRVGGQMISLNVEAKK